MQVKLTSDLKSPFHAIRYLNAQIAYSLSRYNSTATDADFINNALDYDIRVDSLGPTVSIAHISCRQVW